MTSDQVFTVVQVLNLIGLFQCVFVLAIVILKAADIYGAAPTVAFFAALGLGFGVSDDLVPLVHVLIPALSYFLIIQIAIARVPAARHLAVLAVPLLGPAAALIVVVDSGLCSVGGPCPEYTTFLRTFTVVAGAVVLLVLWLQRGLLAQVWRQHDSHDRYWVVLALIAFNALNLGVDLLRVGEAITAGEATLTRAIFGLTFVYLATTLMFRIEPNLVVLLPGLPILRRGIKLTPEEQVVAIRIGDLMRVDKPYQRPTFSRTDLARELDVSKDVVSRVINGAFDKSFRQLLNEHRVNEAKALLVNTDLQVTAIAFDVGFNSLATFNRAFKDITGLPPTGFRAEGADEARADGNDPNGPGANPATPNPSGIRG